MTGEPEREDAAPPRRFGWRTLAIAGAVGVVGFAAVLARHTLVESAAHYAVVEDDTAPSANPRDALSVELSRCRSLEAGTDDAGCRAAWEANRRRFFGDARAADAAPPANAAE